MLTYSALLFLFFVNLGLSKITIKNLNVPPAISINKNEVILSCEYEPYYYNDYEEIEKLQWFFNEQLFYEWIPNNTSIAMGRLEKNVDLNYKPPFVRKKNVIRLTNITTKLTGNYTCKIRGVWTQFVESTKFMFVYVEPKLAEIRYYPDTVIKGKPFTLECILQDPGFPKNISFIWFRRGYKINQSVESKWTINQASLDSRTSFSCVATNGLGYSLPKKVSIDVVAPPTILGKVSSYESVSYLANEFSLSCRIECYPMCSIVWYKNGKLLDTKNDPLYSEVTEHYPPDFSKNEFESIESTLIWSMANNRLEKSSLSRYTCASVSRQDVGPNVNFTTLVAVDTPPENLKLSNYYISVEEGEEAPAVTCKGEGLPHLEYVWKRKNFSEILAVGAVLRLGSILKEQAGYYICEGYNKHGKATAKVYFDVQYKPKCSVSVAFVRRTRVVVCNAEANPKSLSFVWDVLYSNQSIDETKVVEQEKFGHWYSYLTPIKTNKTMVYQCIANNSIGFSYPCKIEVSGAQRKKGPLTWIWHILTLPAYYGLP